MEEEEEEEEEEEASRMDDGEPVGENVEVDPQDDGCLSDADDEAGPSSSYDCQYCTSRFRNAKDLQRHAENVHPHRNTADHQCPHCSFQTTGYYGRYYSLYH